MTECWYNGPRRDKVVALVGGPYSSLEAAKDALQADKDLASEHASIGIDYWTPWEAVRLGGDGPYLTLRDILRGAAGSPTLVRREE